MRVALAIVALAAALCFNASASHASENYPWCAVLMFGAGDVVWDCQYSSVEECRPNVIAGNRGFCNMNPAWPGWFSPKSVAQLTHRKRHIRRH